MSYMNEYISEENQMKHHIQALYGRYGMTSPRPQWTINHETESFLCFMRGGREDYQSLVDFAFSYKGEIVELRFDIRAGGVYKGTGWIKYRKVFIKIPADLIAEEAHIVSEIKQALIEYKDGGIYSKATTYDAGFYF